MMIDWVTGTISPGFSLAGHEPMYDTGHAVVMRPGGELDYEFNTSVSVPSHDTSLRLRSRDGFDLEISGNPAKWFQGHNLFGTDDHISLFLAAGIELRKRVGNFPSPQTFIANEYLPPKFSRLDVTRSYRFANRQQALTWLEYVAASSRTRHGAASLKGGSTVVWGQGSRRWQMKAYLKQDELLARGKSHKLSSKLSDKDQRKLTDWADGILRVELKIQSLELQNHPEQFDKKKLWSEYFGKIEFNRNHRGVDMTYECLPQRLKGYYALWERGDNLKASMKTTTFYRVRTELKKLMGIDIAVTNDDRPEVQLPLLTELNDKNWDPEPIESLLYRPDGELKKQYGIFDSQPTN